MLIPYGRAQRRDQEAPPFAVSMTAWAYIVRSFTPRTEDYDRTLVDLLDTPSIRPKGMVAYQTVADVLGRVDHMVSDSSEEIASRLLVDHAAMADIDTASGEERDAKIEHAITAKTDEMHRQVIEAEAARVDERDARLAAERETAAMKAEVDAHRARADQLAAAVKAEREAREEAERAAANSARNASAANQQIEQTQREHTDELKALRGDLDRQRTMGQRALASVVFVLALAVAIVPLATGWISSGWPWVGIFGAAGLIAYVGLALLFTKKKAAAIATAVVLAIGIANDLHGFAPKDHHSARPSSGPVNQ